MLKKKLQIPATQLLEVPKLAAMEEEKEKLNKELLYCKARLLKFTNKENKWQEDMTVSAENENKCKERHDEIERKLEGREKEIEERMVTPAALTGEKIIVEAMYQVSLKGLELTGLRH